MSSTSFVVAVLVSHTMPFVRRAVESTQVAMARATLDASTTMEIVLVINTRNETFAKEAAQYADEQGLKCVRTPSNGAPGMGHNSCLDLLRSPSSSWTHLIMLDGDDAFYPDAFVLLSRTWKENDLVFLMVHDQVAVDRRPNRHVALTRSFFLYTAHGLERNFWADHHLGDPFKDPLTKCRTPARLLVASRAGVDQLRFDEQCALYDDYLPFVQAVDASKHGRARVVAVSHPDIYCYHACSEESATLKFMKIAQEQAHVRATLAPLRESLQYDRAETSATAASVADASNDPWMSLLRSCVPFQALELPSDGPRWTLLEKTRWVRTHFLDVEMQLKFQRATEAQAAGDFAAALRNWRLLEMYGVTGAASLYTNMGAMLFELAKRSSSSTSSLALSSEWIRPVFVAFYKSLWIEPTAVVAKNLIVLEGARGHDTTSLFRLVDATPALRDDPVMKPHWASLRQAAPPATTLSTTTTTTGRVLLYTGFSPPFHGGCLDQHPVYGSELSAVGLAEALARRGVCVTVACPMPPPEQEVTVRGVRYIDQSRMHLESFDTIIISRFIWILTESWLISRLSSSSVRLILWMHDARSHEWSPHGKLPDDSRTLFRNVLPRVERVLCVSEWHREWMAHWSRTSDLSRFQVCPNGLPPYVDACASLERIPRRFIWASDPSRGLESLLPILVAFDQQVSRDWSLQVFFHQVPPSLLAQLEQLAPDVRAKVVLHGRVHPDQLQREFAQSDYFVYPLHGHETFCINALEAQRQGCIVIAPNSTGLRTSVQQGVLIEGSPDNEGWRDTALRILTDLESQPAKKDEMRQRAHSWASQFTWDRRVQDDWTFL